MDMTQIDLSSFDSFINHQWAQSLVAKYRNKDSVLAEYAITKLHADFVIIKEEYLTQNNQSALTSFNGRVKEEKSLFEKLYASCEESNICMTQESIEQIYKNIKDIAGFRFSCPYSDEILPTINEIIHPKLQQRGSAVDLQSDPMLIDKNYLDQGNDKGYRSYHFYVQVPTVVDIFGKTEPVICEVQARSELQHVWAVKSHDLLYKPDEDVSIDNQTISDMKEISNLLHSADKFLISIRERVKK